MATSMRFDGTEAEQCLLGCMLLNSDCITDVVTIVKDSDFGVGAHRTIFSAIKHSARDSSGGEVDVITAYETLKSLGLADQSPEMSLQYLSSLTQCVPLVDHVMRYAEIVVDRARNRFAIGAVEEITTRVMNGEVSRADLTRMLREQAEKITECDGSLGDFTDGELPTLEEAHELPFQESDYVIESLEAGTVGILAGYGGVGKGNIALALSIDIAIGGQVFNAGEAARGLLTGMMMKEGEYMTAFITVEDRKKTMLQRQQRLAEAIVEKYSGNEVVARRDVFEKLGRRARVISWYGKRNRNLLITDGRGGFVRNEAVINWMKKEFKGYRIIVLDTFRKMAGAIDENNSALPSVVLQIFDEISEETGAAVVCIHHLSKPSGDHKASMPDVFSIRGSSSIVMDARWAALIATPNEELMNQNLSRFPCEDRKQLRVLTIGKANLGEEGGMNWFVKSGGVFVGLCLVNSYSTGAQNNIRNGNMHSKMNNPYKNYATTGTVSRSNKFIGL